MYRAWVLSLPAYGIPVNMIWNSIFFSGFAPGVFSFLVFSSFFFFLSSAHLPSVTLMAIHNQHFVKQYFNSKFIFCVELRWKRFIFFSLNIVAASVAVNLRHHRTDWHKWFCELCRKCFIDLANPLHTIYTFMKYTLASVCKSGKRSQKVPFRRMWNEREWRRKKKKIETEHTQTMWLLYKISDFVHGT